MIGKSGSKRQEFEGGKAVFKHYKVMVKILEGDKIKYQNLEIFTTGLPQLLELRRIHNYAFEDSNTSCFLKSCRNN